MKILVANLGSTSFKYRLFDMATEKVLARGGKYRILEGPEKFGRFVVIEFPSIDRAIACHASKEYQAAAAFRRGGAGEVEMVIVEAGDATPR